MKEPFDRRKIFSTFLYFASTRKLGYVHVYARAYVFYSMNYFWIFVLRYPNTTIPVPYIQGTITVSSLRTHFPRIEYIFPLADSRIPNLSVQNATRSSVLAKTKADIFLIKLLSVLIVQQVYFVKKFQL
jgi:hypothetical protein